MRRVALDAFGTDDRPEPELEAALRAERAQIPIELIGDRGSLESRLQALGIAVDDERETQVSLVHAATQIAMDESPAKAVRSKPDASLCVAMERLAARRVAGVVSAGNSGAILAAALMRLGRLAGVDRPAIATRFPWADRSQGHTVLLDAGANTECKALNLAQFAVMGAVFANEDAGVLRPRVAVLSNGSERSKGTVLTRAAHEILSRHAEFAPGAALEFVGYVEPGELFSSRCDVAVTDGWTGNIALKLAEGAMSAWPRLLATSLAGAIESEHKQSDASHSAVSIAPALQVVARRVDPEVQGGAPLLGVDGVVMICHGGCGPGALLAALETAHRFAECSLTTRIGESIEDHRELFEFARNLR